MLHTVAQAESFAASLDALENGLTIGSFKGRRYAVSVQRLVRSRVTKLFAEELGGTDIVSFNLFRTTNGRDHLKPCEMSSEKVMRFVLEFVSDQ